MTPQNPLMTPTRVMINTIAVIFIIAIAWLLFQIRSIILLLIIGIILAGAIEPLVFRLRRRVALFGSDWQAMLPMALH